MKEIPYDTSIVRTVLKRPGLISPEEEKAVRQSLSLNGMAILRNFVDREATAQMWKSAAAVCARGYGIGTGVLMPPFIDSRGMEFRHPYVCSGEAVEFVTNESLLSLLEVFLDKRPIIHNAVFQITLPREEQVLDYHIDCGSVKSLNPGRKFDDFRLRTILYLTDVETGGFSYILGSADEALKTFYRLPYKELFPPGAVPQNPDRRIVVNEPAGTLIIFNTHGLHRPEIPRARRIVLNTWFARKDFSGNLPGTLFSLGLVPPDRRDRLHIFENERGCTADLYCPEESKPEPYFRRVMKALRPAKQSSDYAYFE